MNTDKTQVITYASIAVIVVSLFFIGIEITGYATTGVVNVTIETSASINFTTALLDLGNGSVDAGQTATVDSSGGNANWDGDQATGNLTLENNGNVNVSFTLKSNKTAEGFIGIAGSTFLVLVSNNEPGSCTNIRNFTAYQAIQNGVEDIACDILTPYTDNNTIAIDVRVTIPQDASGAKTVGITATATAV